MSTNGESHQPVKLDFLGTLQRTHKCGDLRAENAGGRALLMGWVHRRRDLGGVIFLHLRDITGITQIVFRVERDAEVHARAEQIRGEFVVAVEGRVEKRSAETVNANLATGEVELVAEKVWILNESKPAPFPMEDDLSIGEESRLKYRYIDLRRPRMQQNIRMRSDVSFAVRQSLFEQGFHEIETPFMTRSTPEGARDFIIPSRLNPGSFYALPQSPQIFKQLLMVGGYERYFQIVRCFRDEDLRADRQPEFTQIDLEMSFVQQPDVFAVIEKMLVKAFAAAGVSIEEPFPRITYREAMDSYGIDKPDTRIPPFHRVESLFADTPISGNGLPMVAIVIPKAGQPSRKERDELKAFGQEKKLRVFDDAKRLERDYPEQMAKVRTLTGAEDGDLLLLANWAAEPDARLPEREVLKACGQLRLFAAQKYATKHQLFDTGKFNFLWVVDFPMFEWDEEENRWVAAHHPFTSVHDEDLDLLTSEPANCRAKSYDIVLNGVELGSGSIRIHRADVQQKVFSALGFTPEDAQHRFGFLLEGLSYGAPPHGGIALGLDRMVMILAGETSIRDVIAFPKTARGTDLMCEAPSDVPDRLLRDLGIAKLHNK